MARWTRLEASGSREHDALWGRTRGSATVRCSGRPVPFHRLCTSACTRSKPPTALVFAVDLAALGAYDAARETGLTIGRDLSVISYDGIPEGGWANPPLTTFRVDSRMAGERLAGLLIRRIRGVDPEELRETALAELQPGGSDGPPRLSSEDIAARVSAIGMT